MITPPRGVPLFVDLYPRQAPSSSSSSSHSSSTTASTTSSTTAIASSSSSDPIFPTGTPTSPTPTNGKTVPQLVLEWVVAFVAVMILMSLIFCRFTRLRRRGRPLQQLFSRTRTPPPGGRPAHYGPYGGPTHPANVLLPNQTLHNAIHSNALFTIPTLPSSGRGHRGVNGADTDIDGRRGGPVDPDQHGEGIEKEILPAYDPTSKGPPRYAEVLRFAYAGQSSLPNAVGGGVGGGGGEMEMTTLRFPDRHPADHDPFEEDHHTTAPASDPPGVNGNNNNNVTSDSNIPSGDAPAYDDTRPDQNPPPPPRANNNDSTTHTSNTAQSNENNASGVHTPSSDARPPAPSS